MTQFGRFWGGYNPNAGNPPQQQVPKFGPFWGGYNPNLGNDPGQWNQVDKFGEYWGGYNPNVGGDYNATGTVSVTSSLGGPVTVNIAYPRGEGVAMAEVEPYGSYNDSDMPVGTTIRVSYPGMSRELTVPRGSLSVQIGADGRLYAASSMP